jgi:hypothetical protein
MKLTQIVGPYPKEEDSVIKQCKTCEHGFDDGFTIECRETVECRSYEKWKPKTTEDEINSPSHYTEYPVEVIDIIKFVLGPEGFRYYCQGNELKYRLRFGLKDSDITKDTGKAMKYKSFRDKI